MEIEHVIDYHLHKAQELEDEFSQDRRRTRVLDQMNRHRQIAIIMRQWPDFIDFTDKISEVTAIPINPFLANSHRS